jgi:hypothetical protein
VIRPEAQILHALTCEDPRADCRSSLVSDGSSHLIEVVRIISSNDRRSTGRMLALGAIPRRAARRADAYLSTMNNWNGSG